MEQKRMAEIFGSNRNLSTIQAPMTGGSTANAGFGSSFGNFVTDIGQNIFNPLGNLFSSVTPFFGNNSSQQPAVNTSGSSGAQETSGSGSLQTMPNQAFAGSFLNPLTKLLKNPTGAFGTGLIGGLLGDVIGSPNPSVRITRRIKSQARMVLNMSNGNVAQAASILGIDESTLCAILLKRFRNDGPVVTKAALRKTKQTVRRLKSMCDMYDSLRPSATRRRTPMRRATSTTLIKN